MLKIDLILEIMNQIDHYLKEKVTKLTRLMKDELGGKIVLKFVGLRAKTYSYLTDYGREETKTKEKKKCV